MRKQILKATKTLLVIHELLQYRKELLDGFIPPIKSRYLPRISEAQCYWRGHMGSSPHTGEETYKK